MVKRFIRNFKRLDKLLLIFTVLMFLFGLLMISSASYVKAEYMLGNPYHYLIRQGLILIICFVAFLVIINIPINFYKKMNKPIIFGSIALLILVLMFGITVNGSRNWFSLGFFNFQPSEFAKIGLILYMAAYYNKNKDNKEDFNKFVMPLIPCLIMFYLIFKEPDLGGAIIIFFIFIVMIMVVPKYPIIRKKYRRIIFPLILIGTILVITLPLYLDKLPIYDYQKARLNIVKPCARYTEVGTGYQVCNAYIAINNGGLFGVGFGNSTQKYLYLPEAYTDAIFPVIIEECGVIVGICILFIYIIIIFKILQIGKKSKDLNGDLICIGISSYIFIHIIINLGGLFGLIPLTGVPLPFLSYGGSYALALTIALGIVQRINIENKIYKDEENIKNKIREI